MGFLLSLPGCCTGHRERTVPVAIEIIVVILKTHKLLYSFLSSKILHSSLEIEWSMALPEHWADDWRSWVPDHRAWEVAFAGFQAEY